MLGSKCDELTQGGHHDDVSPHRSSARAKYNKGVLQSIKGPTCSLACMRHRPLRPDMQGYYYHPLYQTPRVRIDTQLEAAGFKSIYFEEKKGLCTPIFSPTATSKVASYEHHTPINKIPSRHAHSSPIIFPLSTCFDSNI